MVHVYTAAVPIKNELVWYYYDEYDKKKSG